MRWRRRQGGRVLLRGGSRVYRGKVVKGTGVALCMERWSLARKFRWIGCI